MKKVYSLVASLLAVSFTAFSQSGVSPEATAVKGFTKQLRQPKMTETSDFFSGISALAPSYVAVPERATTFLSESFTGATFPPTGWTKIDGTSSTVHWSRTTTAGRFFSGPGGAQCFWEVAPQDESLITPVINLTSSSNPYLNFKFQGNYYYMIAGSGGATDNCDLKVYVSIDGGTTYAASPVFTETSVLTTATSGKFVDVKVPLTGAAGQANVKVKFRYTGNDGDAIFVDDVVIFELPPVDLTARTAFYPVYTSIPTKQRDSVAFFTEVVNNGSVSQSNWTLNSKVNGGSTYDSTLTYSTALLSLGIGTSGNPYPSGFPSLAKDTFASILLNPGRFKPAGAGTYTVVNRVTPTAADDNTTDNAATKVYVVNDTIYARETGFPSSQLPGILADGSTFAYYYDKAPFMLGNIYRFRFADQANSISFAVSNTATLSVAGAKLRVRLKKFVTGTGWVDEGTPTAIYTLTAADRPTAINPINKWVTLKFPTPINLAANTTYMACVERVVAATSDSTNIVRILGANNTTSTNVLTNDDFGSLNFSISPGASTFDPLPYGMDDVQFAIRLNTVDPCPGTITSTVSTVAPTCLLNNGSLSSGAPTGGAGPYVYTWGQVTGTVGSVITSGTNSSVTGLAPGTYSLLISDANGCSSALSTYSMVNSGTPSTLTSGAATANPTSCGGTGTVEVSVSSGAAIASVNWTKGGTGVGTTNPLTGAGITAGSYVASVTNTAGCISTFSVTISDPTTYSATYTSVAVKCKGDATGTVTINVTPAGAYSYSFGGSPVGTNNSFTGINAGTYSFNVVQGSCSLAGSAVVTEPATSFTAGSATGTNINCFGQTTGTVTVSGTTGGGTPYAYSWTGTASGSNTTGTVTGLGAGTYNLTVTDANGCVKTPTGSPVALTQPAAALAMTKTASATKSATFSVSGGTAGYTFSVVSGPGSILGSTILAAAGSKTLNFTVGGTYTIKVTDAKGCTVTLTAVDVPTGVQEMEGVSSIAVFPNPTENEITISLNVVEARSMNVKLVSLNGQVIYTQNLDQFVGEFNKTVNLSENAKGIYFLQITSDKNVVTKKVVKL